MRYPCNPPQVDESHPALLEAHFTLNGASEDSTNVGAIGLALEPLGAGAASARAPGIEWVEWRRDLFGRPRFVHLRVKHPPV